jgi:hypothetical protein
MLIEYIGNQGTASWSTTENGNVRENISQFSLSWYIFQIISYRTFSQGIGPMSYVHKVFTDSLWTKDTCLRLNRKGMPGRSSLHT